MKQVLRTSDRAEAESFISDVYLPMAIDVIRGGSVQIETDGAQLDSVTVGRLATSRESRVYSEVPAEDYHVNVPLQGRVLCRGGAEGPAVTAPGQASVFMPGQAPDTPCLGGTAQLCIVSPARHQHDHTERARRWSLALERRRGPPGNGPDRR